MSRPRLLIVDDKPTMRRLCRDILCERYEVDVAADGQEALQKLDAVEFDVVVTDVRMPALDGRGLLDAIRLRGSTVQVILMTAFGSIRGAVDAIKAGAFEYLSKPFTPDELEAAVERALERRDQAAEEAGPLPPAPDDPAAISYREALSHARERTSQQYISRLLRACDGNVTRAADLAGIERESLHRLMRRHGIRAEDFRPRDRQGGPDDDAGPEEPEE